MMSNPPANPPIVRYDLRYAEAWSREPGRLRAAWDHCHAVAALQGIVNRHGARLYLRAIHTPEGGDVPLDDWWLDKLQRRGAWLAKRKIDDVPDFDALLKRFRREYHGLVVYDESVPATSCVASTVAGVDDLIPVRYDTSAGSLYRHLTEDLKLPVKAWLLHPDGKPLFTGAGRIPGSTDPSTGSAKNDAYRWAISRFVETGRCGTEALGFYIDAAWLKNPNASTFWNHTLTNHDYFVGKRSFFFDLSPWDDEPATDDPAQTPGLDAETLKMLFAAVAQRNGTTRMAHVGGFIPWAYKYTNLVGGKHEGVPSEWRCVEILSAYNAGLDADALGLCAMANASFFAHQPLPEYPPERGIETAAWEKPGGVAAKHYVAFYVGDYDSAAWLYQMLPKLWEDPARGSVPMGWAFNPTLALRFPAAFWYTRQTRTPDDSFTAGDSGAGYVNPSLLETPRPSGLPSAVALWERHNAEWYSRQGLSLTGFVIDGNAPPMPNSVLDAYARFSPGGTVAQKVPEFSVHKGMPLMRMSDDLGGSPQEAAHRIASRLTEAAPTFHIFRGVLQKPSWYAAVAAELRKANPDAVVVDPYALMRLAKRNADGAGS
ncbi:MAG TPA: GxGYxYP domain-containing protein [Armatimonadota bacterium]|jgi:hypothetical protein